ncbi:MAG TPA: hypothetical protein VKE26_26135 [Xanthobacteraceae bacterium]|nr:hypothetical protein [Xanthobacteraceae bacterium]
MLLPLTEDLIATWAADPDCARLADRHYSRGRRGHPQFAPSGRKLVLRDTAGLVVFVWLFPEATYRRDGQVGYNNTLFRNESSRLSSAIILEAERYAVAKWGPNRGYTYIDARKVASPNPGYCFKCAGWVHVGYSKDQHLHLLEKWLVAEGR